MTRSSFTSI